MTFTLSEVTNMAVNFVAVLGTAGTAYWKIKMEIAASRAEVAAVKQDIKALREEIHGNGFLRKDVADQMMETADAAHREFDRRLSSLEKR